MDGRGVRVRKGEGRREGRGGEGEERCLHKGCLSFINGADCSVAIVIRDVFMVLPRCRVLLISSLLVGGVKVGAVYVSQ